MLPPYDISRRPLTTVMQRVIYAMTYARPPLDEGPLIYIYIYIYIYTYIYIYIHTCVYIIMYYVYVHVYIYIYIYIYFTYRYYMLFIRVCVCICMYVYMYIYIYVFIYSFIYIHIYIYIYMYSNHVWVLTMMLVTYQARFKKMGGKHNDNEYIRLCIHMYIEHFLIYYERNVLFTYTCLPCYNMLIFMCLRMYCVNTYVQHVL